MSTGSKQYGLIVPQKGASKGSTLARSNVFGDDSDSASDDGGDWVKKALKRESGKSVQKRTTKNQIKQALKEDPTVYQYDEVYEEIEQKKAEAKASKKDVEKKPRYIQALLQTAERRKREAERRIERQVQKEREEEGAEFADKESFVTASYRQKLEEFKKQDEEEKRMERLEAIADVSKQKDLTGFYRHLFRQTMGETLPGADQSSDNKDAETQQASPVVKVKVEKDDHEQNRVHESEEPDIEADMKNTKPEVSVKKEERKDRQYRKRRSNSTSSSEGSEHENKIARKDDQNVDVDSDFAEDSSSSGSESDSSASSSSEEGEIRHKKDREKHDAQDESKEAKKKSKATKAEGGKSVITSSDGEKEKVKVKRKSVDHDSSIEKKEAVKEENSKPKINIWAKRTVGQVFDDALKRYFDRKAARMAARVIGRG